MAEGVLKINLSEIKALSKEARLKLALAIRRDPELFNAVNGIGGLSENSLFGMLQGTVTEGELAKRDVAVIAIGKDRIQHIAKTNQYGYYKMQLESDAYTVSFELAGVKMASSEVVISRGVTSTLNNKVDGVQIPPEEERKLIEETAADVNPLTETEQAQ